MDPKTRDMLALLILAFAIVFVWGAAIPQYVGGPQSFSYTASERALAGVTGGSASLILLPMLTVLGLVFCFLFVKLVLRLSE